jgi:hypothetical protein
VEVDHYRDTTFVITNTGSGSLSGNITAPCQHYSIVGASSYNLSGGESDTFTVRFLPTAVGTTSCTIQVGHSACSDVQCSGTGVVIRLTEEICVVFEEWHEAGEFTTPRTVDFSAVMDSIFDDHDLYRTDVEKVAATIGGSRASYVLSGWIPAVAG